MTIELELDDSDRRVEPPPELVTAFADDAALEAAFQRLSYTHQREFAEWIADAKRPETRERRVAKTIEMVRAGQHR